MPFQAYKNALVFPSVAESEAVGLEARRGKLANALLRERIASAPIERQAVKQDVSSAAQADRLERLAVGANLMSTVTDKPSYITALQQLETMFPDTFEQDFGDMPNVSALEQIQAQHGVENIFGLIGEQAGTVAQQLGGGADVEMQTIYGPEGQTRRVPVTKGQEYIPPEGYSLQKPSTTETPEQKLERQKELEQFKVDLSKQEKAEKQKQEKLDDLMQRYFQQIGRFYSARRGVGQFIQDPNKEQVAEESFRSAAELAIQYKNMGGDPADLGLTKEGIKAGYQAERISEEMAVYLLRNLFDME